MADIKTFIADARAKGLNDEQIRNALKAKNWDDITIDIELLGLEVPVATVTREKDHKEYSTQIAQPSLSHLMAALQHVLLWFFTASSTVTIVGVIASLSGTEVSSQILATMVAVTLVTFLPYAILFLMFATKAYKQPELIPSKVWSIITICLHSIGAMVAAITLVVAAINSADTSVFTSALLILTLNIIIIVTYCFATFSPLRLAKIKKIVLVLHLIVLTALFGSLFIMSILQLEPAKHDEQLRSDLVKTVRNVREYTEKNNTLPTSGANITSGETTYKRITNATYEVCGEFKIRNKNSYADVYNTSERTLEDSYVYENDFSVTAPGNKCFTITSSILYYDNYNDYR